MELTCRYRFYTLVYVYQLGLSKDLDKIYVFENYIRSMKLAKEHHIQNGFAFKGMYIKIYIQNFNADLL